MSTPAAPGWFEDPPGSGALRWWDGSRWAADPNTIEQPPLAPGTRTGTWAIWVMSLLPLVGPVATLALDVPARLRAQLAAVARQTAEIGSAHPHVVPLGFSLAPAAIASQVLGLVLVAAQVLLAALDSRALARRGVVRPFHWAWAFLQPVYLIGRAVVVHRRTGRGLAPLWSWIAVEVAALAVTAALIAPSFGALR